LGALWGGQAAVAAAALTCARGCRKSRGWRARTAGGLLQPARAATMPDVKFDMPGQTKELSASAADSEALKSFYSSLHEQRPDSEMASRWLLQHGLLERDEAEKLAKQFKKPAPSKSAPSKTAKRPKADDEDDFEEPKKKAAPKKKLPPKAKKKAAADSSDEEEEDDDEPEDSSEDEYVAPKKKPPPKAKGKPPPKPPPKPKGKTIPPEDSSDEDEPIAARKKKK